MPDEKQQKTTKFEPHAEMVKARQRTMEMLDNVENHIDDGAGFLMMDCHNGIAAEDPCFKGDLNSFNLSDREILLMLTGAVITIFEPEDYDMVVHFIQTSAQEAKERANAK